jgi:hypothetical protein
MDTHAEAATTALRDAAAPPMAAVAAAVSRARDAQATFREAEDVIQVMGATAGLILALEALEEAAKRAETAMRAVLAETMWSTGATTFRTEAHTVSAKEATRRVVITGQVPPELMVPQPPKPDLDGIKQRLRDGRLDFAELSNGGPPVLQIRTRERKAA